MDLSSVVPCAVTTRASSPLLQRYQVNAMRSSTSIAQHGLPCACPEPLTSQLRRRLSETQQCVASPFAQTESRGTRATAHGHELGTPPAHHFDARALLRKLCIQFPHVRYASGRALFRQGDPADAFFYVASGRLHRTITTEKGNERLVAIVREQDFCGEECLARQRYRTTSAIVAEDAEIVRIDKGLMPFLMRDWADFADAFTASLLSHCLETEAALIDQLIGSVEQRLKRVLLKLATVGNNDRQVGVIFNVKQEMLAGLVGTTRPRVNYFLNKFRRLGLIEYGETSSRGEIRVHAALDQTTGKA